MIKIEQTSVSTKKSGILTKYISNPKERRLVSLFLMISLVLLLLGGLWSLQNYQDFMSMDFREFKRTFKQFGSISRIGFFAVLSIYPIFLLVKSKQIKNLQIGGIELKKILQPLARTVRKWHVPAALVCSSLALFHGFLAILRDFKPDFTYLSGIVSLVMLFILMSMGLKRYKRADRNWHLRLAIGFLVIFMLHASF